MILSVPELVAQAKESVECINAEQAFKSKAANSGTDKIIIKNNKPTTLEKTNIQYFLLSIEY